MTTQSRSYWPDQAHRETDRGPATGGCSLCQRMSWMRLITQPTRRARRSSTTTPASWNIIRMAGSDRISPQRRAQHDAGETADDRAERGDGGNCSGNRPPSCLSGNRDGGQQATPAAQQVGDACQQLIRQDAFVSRRRPVVFRDGSRSEAVSPGGSLSTTANSSRGSPFIGPLSVSPQSGTRFPPNWTDNPFLSGSLTAAPVMSR